MKTMRRIMAGILAWVLFLSGPYGAACEAAEAEPFGQEAAVDTAEDADAFETEEAAEVDKEATELAVEDEETHESVFAEAAGDSVEIVSDEETEYKFDKKPDKTIVINESFKDAEGYADGAEGKGGYIYYHTGANYSAYHAVTSYLFNMDRAGYVDINIEIPVLNNNGYYNFYGSLQSMSRAGAGGYYYGFDSYDKNNHKVTSKHYGMDQGQVMIECHGLTDTYNVDLYNELYEAKYKITIEITYVDHWEMEDNDNSSHPNEINLNETYWGVISFISGDWDCYKFTLEDDSPIVVSYDFGNSGDGNWRMMLYDDSTGGDIDSSENKFNEMLTGRGKIVTEKLTAGDYYITILPDWDNYSDNYYNFSVSNKLVMVVGDTTKLKYSSASLSDSDFISYTVTEDTSGSWTFPCSIDSYDAGIATVRANSVGSNEIHVEINSSSSVEKITVIVLDMNFELSDTTLYIGETRTLTARINLPSGGYDTVKWEVEDDDIASISLPYDSYGSNCDISGKQLGTTTVTARSSTYPNIYKSHTINVVSEELTLDESALDMIVGETKLLTPTLKRPSGKDKTVNWSSSDTSVATVSGGRVTAVGGGTATITARCADDTSLSATCSVTVTSVNGITLSESDVMLGVGETLELTATIDPEEAADTGIEWSSSSSAVTVDDNGVLTAKYIGIATITATSRVKRDITATCRVVVAGVLSESSSYYMRDSLSYTNSSAVTGEDGRSRVYYFLAEKDGYMNVRLSSDASTKNNYTFTFRKFGGSEEMFAATRTGIDDREISVNIGIGAGAYEIEVSTDASNYRSDTYAVQISFTAAGGWEQEPNGSVESATPIKLNREYSGNLISSTDRDHYSFTLREDAQINIFYSTESENNTAKWNVSLSNAAGAITSDTFDRTGGVLKELGKLEAGTYYLAFSAGTGTDVHSNRVYRFMVSGATTTGGIVLDQSDVRLYPGQEISLSAFWSQSSMGRLSSDVSWISSDESVAMVKGAYTSAHAQLAGISAGTVLVTVSAMNAQGEAETASATVTVYPSEVYPQDEALITTSKIVVAGITDKTYTGSPITQPDLRIYDGRKRLRPKIDYTVSYSNNKNVSDSSGPAVVKIKFKGNYTGEREETFRIKAASSQTSSYRWRGISIKKTKKGSAWISKIEYSTKPAEQPTTGVLTYGGQDLVEGRDYTTSYINNNAVGKATVTFTGIGEFTGTLKKTFKITAIPISEVSVSYNRNCVYEKGGAKPDPVMTFTETVELVSGLQAASANQTETRVMTLENGVDYTIKYKKAKISASSGAPTGSTPWTMTIKGKGLFRGSVSYSFDVTNGDVSKLQIIAGDTELGKKWKAAVTIIDKNGKALKKNTDYKLTYPSAVPLSYGPVTVVITGAGNYAGSSTTAVYQVGSWADTSLSKAKVTGIFSETYNAGMPVVMSYYGINLKYGRETLTANRDYEVIGCYNNRLKGKATVKLRGIGEYTGIKTVTYKIKAKGVY